LVGFAGGGTQTVVGRRSDLSFARIILVDDVSLDDTVADAGVDNEQRRGSCATAVTYRLVQLNLMTKLGWRSG
jgi:hypothetical protein